MKTASIGAHIFKYLIRGTSLSLSLLLAFSSSSYRGGFAALYRVCKPHSDTRTDTGRSVFYIRYSLDDATRRNRDRERARIKVIADRRAMQIAE